MSNSPVFTPNYDKTAQQYTQIIQDCGEDLTREGLVDTPMRASKAFYYLTRGYHQSLDVVANFIHCVNTIYCRFMAWHM